MEVLHAAASLTPLPVLCKTRRVSFSSLPVASLPKNPNFSAFVKTPPALHGGLVLLSSLLPGGLSRALSYEEALQQTTGSESLDFNPNGVVDSVGRFVTENPTVATGGAVALAVPLILSQLFKNSKPWGVETSKSAYAKLGEDATAQLLDIRGAKEFREAGGPDIRGFGKKPVSIAFNGEDKPGFFKKLALKFKEPETTTLFIMDNPSAVKFVLKARFDGNSELVAELVTANGFKAAYAIKDGAEGPQGWMNSGLPWIPPKKGLDLSNLTETLSGALGDGSDGLSVTLGLAAATGLGLLAFSEIETVLQLVGSAAIIQLLSKKLLFAEDRKQTLKQIDEFLSTKVAPKELIDDMKEIGAALIPPTTTSKALPAPTEANPEPKDEVSAQSVPEINAVPKPESKADGSSGTPRPLSPYPSYPDFKPPTSPTPSQP
ncbi:rhodanese-like domain-containing protein 4, chloroplastic isoform X1 [Hibiscus syriacus]|uniref:rhodanese-like domain-containing protein 4, chloroplastic isoform X1 n=1 Tax=Hibiscus syriacus TaxID=106335 RepID=UPI001922D42B|nr:rhodanese-like domain-containing protein 4, chloroplastic isoform X1 [Hibiscus syriacus]